MAQKTERLSHVYEMDHAHFTWEKLYLNEVFKTTTFSTTYYIDYPN